MMIRKATLADLEQLIPLFHAYRSFYQQSINEQGVIHFLTESLQNKDVTIFVVVDEIQNNLIIAFAKLNLGWCSLNIAKYWILYDLFVDPVMRATGIAKILLSHIEAFAIESGACRIELQTAADNLPAQKLYHKASYEEERHFLSYVRILPAPTPQQQKKVEVLPATIYQQQLWRDQQRVPQDLKYNVNYLWQLSGNLNIKALTTAWEQLVHDHPALRTRFEKKNDQLFQVINESHTIALEVHDFSNADKESLDKFLYTKCRHQFDLEKFPLAFAYLIKLKPTSHNLLFNFHHIIIDGTSIDLLIQQLSEIYNVLVAGQPIPAPINTQRMEEYLKVERQRFNEQQKQVCIDYWQQQLESMPREIKFPLSNLNVAECNTDKKLTFELPLTIKKYAKDNNFTVFIVVSALFIINLNLYAKQNELVIGYPTNRRGNEFQGLLGYFVNTLPLPIKLSSNLTFTDIAMAIKAQRNLITQCAYDVYPMSEMIKSVGTNLLANQPLFNIVISPTAYGKPMLSEIEARVIPMDIVACLYDMMLLYESRDATIACALEFKTAKFPEALMKSFIQDLSMLATQCIENPGVAIGVLLSAKVDSPSAVRMANL